MAGDPARIDRALKQALRELLLLQSSDWQFLIATGAAIDYAERRFATHYVELKRHLDLVRRMVANPTPDPTEILYLDTMEMLDRVFPDMELSWYSAQGSPAGSPPSAQHSLASGARGAKA